VIIHHCGIDASRPRGHTSLTGAVESQLKVERAVTGEVIVTVEFAKDFEEGTQIVSRFEKVEIGIDPDGDVMTSFVVLPTEAAPQTRNVKPKLSPRQQRAVEALAEAVLAHGVDLPTNYGLASGLKGVTDEQWREEILCRKVIDKKTTKNLRARLAELRDQLAVKRVIGVRDEWVWLA